MTTITLTDTELATVLAALRAWQEGSKAIQHLRAENATFNGDPVPLDADAIDALCERINTAPEPRIAVVVQGGMVQSVVTDAHDFVGTKFMVIDYDTKGADPDETIQVPQEGGGFSRAFRMGDRIALAGIGLKEVDDTIEWEG